MPDGCPGYPEDGAYYISTSNLCVGNQQVGDVDNIVVNDQKTAFYLRWLHANPCTYEINLGDHQDSTQFVRHDKQWINIYNGQYQQWVLNKVSGNTYTIAQQDNTSLVWTDPGPGGPANRQLQLQTFKTNNSNQQFLISED
ncbi:hypothetical protein SCLCIDRAFT_1216465 [Scleroderma citrinum Foug A]|uniref:Ricin B lectin domain-containing protein n=1 Tax=Scleroderma citrinum Foug A TaxID=1036808 RepID=A0A0C3DXY3_9AGAM|nr:hypothetical protein SCLCIDRAFT_1216465 [Scleroderma citrinum Foug A]